ncbi:MAG: hypothetical protein AUJ97_04150 [Bacteroidetes bacterium CG2_30_32_10]|nr:MAG: hypothetical protein AUJ97_04150 [Bacteroidetes bacterium CG2_30_32_10]
MKIVRKILKYTGITFLVLLVLIIVLPIIFKGAIVRKVKEEANKNINAKLYFKDWGLSLFRSFPNFSLELDSLTLIGVKEFEKDTLANIPKLYVSLDLMSVIRGSNYKIKSVRLENPKILLKVLKGGKANWDITKPSTDTTKKTEAPSEPSNFKLTLKKVLINKADIVYDDADMGVLVKMNNFTHQLSGDMTEDFTTLKTKSSIEFFTVIYEGVKYFNKTNVDLKMDLDADLKNMKFTFKENELKLNELYLGFDGWLAMPKSDIDMDIKFSAKKTDFKNFLSLVPGIYSKDFEKMETKGTLALDGFAKGTYNDTKMPAYALNILIENAMFKYPDLPKAVTNIAMKANISCKDANTDNTIIDVSRLHFEMADNPVDIKLHVTTPISDANIDATIKGKINLATVKDFYPLATEEQLSGKIEADITFVGRMSSVEKSEYDKVKALGEIVLNEMNYKSKDFPQGITIHTANLKFSPQYIDLTAFDAKMGKSDINAKGKIDNLLSYIFKGQLLSGKFQMNSNLLDLNEFMGEPQPSSTTTEPTTLSVIEVPANIDFALNATFGKILYDKMEMTNVLGVVKIKDQQVILENLKMNLLNGQMTVSGSYGTQNSKQPLLDFMLDMKNFDIPQTYKTFVTFQKLAPIAEKTTGNFSAKFTLKSALDEKMSPVFNTMNGEGVLSSSQVKVQGFEVLNKLADALKMDKYKTMMLDKASFAFSFENGMVTIKPFDINFDKTKANISGTHSIDQNINYVMHLDIPKNQFSGQANTLLNGMVSQLNTKGGNVNVSDPVKMDVIIGGTVSKPTVKVGLKGAMDNAIEDLKNQVKDELNKKKDELENKVKDEADKLKKDAEEKLKQSQLEADKKKKAAEDSIKRESDRLKKEADEKLKKEQEELKNKIKIKLKK